jgi:uncharacterized protein YkwD
MNAASTKADEKKRGTDPTVRLLGLGSTAPLEHRLNSSQISIGSDPQNDFVVTAPTVSRRHALIRHKLGGYTISDLQSTNGTFVNGKRIKSPLPIRPGDEIRLGNAKFAIVGGAGSARMKRRRSTMKRAGALAGIVLFAIAGFLGTQYAMTWNRLIAGASSSPGAGPSESLAKTAISKPRDTIKVAAAVAAEPPIDSNAAKDTSSPIWLKRLNDFRASVKLPPVATDPKMSDGDRKHSTYVVKNAGDVLIHGGDLGASAHTEDRTNQWYTPEGDEAARSSDLADRASLAGSRVPDPQQWAIEGWMVVPFHRLFLLNPGLRTVGFGSDCENNLCVGADPLPRTGIPLRQPILYPPDGASLPSTMRKFDSEWPSPISGCDGYSFPSGLPATLQLGPVVDAQLSAFSFARDDGTKLETCGFDATSYRNPDPEARGRVVDDLHSAGAVVIVPREPLEAGRRYKVAATVNGRDYDWEFAIAR